MTEEELKDNFNARLMEAFEKVQKTEFQKAMRDCALYGQGFMSIVPDSPVMQHIPFKSVYICEHKWVSQKLDGDPTEVSSNEWVDYCEFCGVEKEKIEERRDKSERSLADMHWADVNGK